MGTTIGEIQKNATEKILVTESEYKGRRFIDVRVYFEGDDGEYKPTKKGIALSGEVIDDIIEFLKEGSKKLKGE